MWRGLVVLSILVSNYNSKHEPIITTLFSPSNSNDNRTKVLELELEFWNMELNESRIKELRILNRELTALPV